ncbi:MULTISPECIES: hypothetical protein [unclassified Flavobacterium]|uniref:hypothetical protein n=1 Tax=unclassified Flavobacterium TaxID=196869 RepID=UPI0026027761|nr:hypothetical protein [Flavobacterium sp.]
MNTIKSIVVGKKYPNLKRDITFGITPESYSEIGYLSELDLDVITDIISELDALITKNDPNDYVEWGVDLFSVLSFPERSKCTDMIHGVDLTDISTSYLITYMRQLESFKEQYSDATALNSILERAFQQVKNDPPAFKKWEDAPYYEIPIDSVLISLNLSETDLQLSNTEYIDQIQ